MTFRAWEDDDLNSAGRSLVAQARDETNRVERMREEINRELELVIGMTAMARIAVGYDDRRKIAEGCALLDKILARPAVGAYLRSRGRTCAREVDEGGSMAETYLFTGNPAFQEGYDAFYKEKEKRS